MDGVGLKILFFSCTAIIFLSVMLYEETSLNIAKELKVLSQSDGVHVPILHIDVLNPTDAAGDRFWP